MLKELYTETISDQPHTITLNVYGNSAVKIWEVKHDYRRLLVTWSEDEAIEKYEKEVKKLQYQRECIETKKQSDDKDKEKEDNEMLIEKYQDKVFNQQHTITLNSNYHHENGQFIWTVKHNDKLIKSTVYDEEARYIFENEVGKLQYQKRLADAVKVLDKKDKEKENNEWSVLDMFDFIDEHEEYSIVIGKIPAELKNHPERIKYCSFNEDLDHWMTVVKL